MDIVKVFLNKPGAVKFNCLLVYIMLIVLFMVLGQSESYCSANEENNFPRNSTTFLNEMVTGTDASVLPHGTFLRFQEIKLAGDGCSSNYRFLLFQDGRFFLQENKGDECRHRPKGSKFNRPYDSLPLKVMDAEQMEIIRAALKKCNFEALQTLYRPAGKVFDGSIKTMEVNKGNQIQRVVSYNNSCKELEVILQVIWEQVYE